MIKLKQILREVTDYDFKLPKEENANKVIKVLKALKMKFSSQDAKNSYNHLKNFEGGKMFKHMQYHIVQGTGSPDVYFIHQTQHWLHDEKVGVTKLLIAKYEDYENDQNKRTNIGTALVQTDKFVDQLRKVTVLKKNS